MNRTIKFTKNTKLARITSEITGYYSGVKLNRVAYLPLDFYEYYEDALDYLADYYVDYDGKHSEGEGDIRIEKGKLSDIITCSNDDNEVLFEAIEETIYNWAEDADIEIDKDFVISSNDLKNIHDAVVGLKADKTIKTITDNVIDGFIVPAGTVISFSTISDHEPVVVLETI